MIPMFCLNLKKTQLTSVQFWKMMFYNANLHEKEVARRNKVLCFLVGLALYAIPTACLFYFINKKLPDPFIDEVFHIPQGIKYMQGNYTEVIIYNYYALSHNLESKE